MFSYIHTPIYIYIYIYIYKIKNNIQLNRLFYRVDILYTLFKHFLGTIDDLRSKVSIRISGKGY